MYSKQEIYVNDLDYISNLDLSWNDLKNSKILITGSTGMIGTFLVDSLLYKSKKSDLNITIYALGRNKERAKARFLDYFVLENFVFVAQDVNNPFDLEEKVDYIFHCASNTHPKQYATDPIGTITTNIIGTKNVLDYAVFSKTKRVVFLSSVEIYGENRGDVELFDESYCGYIDCNTLRAGYPEGKRAGEALCQAYSEKYGLDIVIPRICRVYGPTILDSDTKALAQFIRNAVNKEDIVLKSNGAQYYSYLHVTDVVAGLLFVLFKGDNKNAYNISDNNSNIYLRDLAKLLADCNDTKVVFDLPDETEKKGFSKATKALLCNDKLLELGWNCKYEIPEGVKNTVDFLMNK